MKGKYFAVKAGSTFGKLTVLDMRSVVRGKTSPRREVQLLCKCEFCGSEKWYPKSNVVNGRTKSCGCSASKETHGERYTRLYGIWSGMKRRCYVATCKAYKYYGGRGIKVCKEWHEYIPFRDWALSHGYTEKLTIDRIDVNGDYCPENCRWATYLVQMNNKRNNRIVEYQGKKCTMAELAREHGLSSSVVSARLRKGLPMDLALSKEDFRGRVLKEGKIKGKTYAARGEVLTSREWAVKLNMDVKKLRGKLFHQHEDMEKVLLLLEFKEFREEYKKTHKGPCSYDYWLAHRQ
jgi:hypothetical protein